MAAAPARVCALTADRRPSPRSLQAPPAPLDRTTSGRHVQAAGRQGAGGGGGGRRRRRRRVARQGRLGLRHQHGCAQGWQGMLRRFGRHWLGLLCGWHTSRRCPLTLLQGSSSRPRRLAFMRTSPPTSSACFPPNRPPPAPLQRFRPRRRQSCLRRLRPWTSLLRASPRCRPAKTWTTWPSSAEAAGQR